MSTRAEFFQSMYPGLSNGEVIDELIKASIYGFEHGPEVVTISAAEGIHYVPYDAAMQKKLPYYGGTYEACNIPFTDFQIRYQPEQIRIVDGKRILPEIQLRPPDGLSWAQPVGQRCDHAESGREDFGALCGQHRLQGTAGVSG